MILDIHGWYMDKIILSKGTFLFVTFSLDSQRIFAVIFGYTSSILPILFESQQKSQGGEEGGGGRKEKLGQPNEGPLIRRYDFKRVTAIPHNSCLFLLHDHDIPSLMTIQKRPERNSNVL